MQETIKAKFQELTDMLDHISNEEYAREHSELSKATIGQHTRHIIELFQSLANQYDEGVICYDNRKRDEAIQTDTDIASSVVSDLVIKLNRPDKNLKVNQQLGDFSHTLQSSYHRELLYNIEHCIHHQALIKVALLKGKYTIPEEFGVAPSTIRHRRNQ